MGMSKTNRSKGKAMKSVNIDYDPVSAALKQMHAAVASEPVPDDFMRILDEIDAKIAAAKSLQ
jgi:Anti-sigma factor NepR